MDTCDGRKGWLILFSSFWFSICLFNWQWSWPREEKEHRFWLTGRGISFFCISFMQHDRLNHINDVFKPSPHPEEAGWEKCSRFWCWAHRWCNTWEYLPRCTGQSLKCLGISIELLAWLKVIASVRAFPGERGNRTPVQEHVFGRSYSDTHSPGECSAWDFTPRRSMLWWIEHSSGR